jgi:hypothetical protein
VQSQRTWEIETLLTNPEENIAVHQMMGEGIVEAVTS